MGQACGDFRCDNPFRDQLRQVIIKHLDRFVMHAGPLRLIATGVQVGGYSRLVLSHN